MNHKAFLFLSCAIISSLTPLHAEPKKKPRPLSPPTEFSSQKEPDPIDFNGENLATAIRTLAESAKVHLVVSNDVTGTLTMQLIGKTPREAIDIIAKYKELLIEEKSGVLFVRSKNPPPPAETPETLGPAFAKFYEAFLDFQARPETAAKLARVKKAYYDALIAEGFTKEDALRVILSHQELPLPTNK